MTYSVVAFNNGPSAVVGTLIDDTLPAALTGATWTCAATAGATCAASGSGSITDTINLAVGSTATYTITATISSTATGSLTNTATITAPAGTTDPTAVNNAATDTDALNPTADLAITKTDGVLNEIPGTGVTYTVVASNNGPSAVVAAVITDTLPAALTGATWTCAGAAGATCAASGNGSINDTINLAVGATATYTITATIASNATGTMSNTATIATPAGTTDPTAGNNSANDTNTLVPTADLAITKTDNTLTAVPGTPTTYTIVATNNGPSTVTGTVVTDNVPVALSNVVWTCVASVGATCGATSGSGSISETINLAPGATATYTLTGDIPASATGTLANTVTLSTPTGVVDPIPANNTATDTDTLGPRAELSITKTDNSATAIPGTPVTYTIVALNSGPSLANGVIVADTLPATLTSATWTCVASAGATCAASGSGSIGDTVNLPVGGSATYTLTATIAATALGTLSNTATITAPAGTGENNVLNNTASDTDTLLATADLAITKTDSALTAVPGTGSSCRKMRGSRGRQRTPSAPWSSLCSCRSCTHVDTRRARWRR